MSCGDPHETDCREVLAEVYLYLDLGGEAGDERAQVAQRADGFALLWRSEQTCHPSPRMILGR